MSVGLLDLDMKTYTQVPINLEIAKLSSYYKGKRELVAMSPSFQPSRFSKFIIRKDYEDGIYPRNLLNFDNIEYGGYAFSNGLYVPLPRDIEIQKPDLSVYERYRKEFSTTKEFTQAFETMSNAQHLRLSLDGKTVWNEFERQLWDPDNVTVFFFHDKDLNQIDGAFEVIQDLTKESTGLMNGFVGMKFPVVVDNAADLLKWCSFKPASSFFCLQYNGIMDDEVMTEFVTKRYGKSFLRQLDYVVTIGFKDQDDFIQNGLLKIYRQIMFLRMHRVKISLKYESNFFLDPQWERLLRLFECFATTAQHLKDEKFRLKMQYDSLYSFVSSFKEQPFLKKYIFSKQDARDLFGLVRENNYEVFDDFYNCHLVKLEKGEFVRCNSWR